MPVAPLLREWAAGGARVVEVGLEGRLVADGGLTEFPFRSSLAGMTWANDEELRLIIRRGLREGFNLIRGTRRSLTEDQERVIAEAVVKHLEMGNWRVERAPL